MINKNFYKILGVEKNTNTQEIKRAYKRLAMKYHPDRNPNNPSSEEKFKEVKEAYEVLSDTNKRYNYDNYGIDSNNNYYNDNDNNTNGFNFEVDGMDINSFVNNLKDNFDIDIDHNYNQNLNLNHNLEINFNESIFGTHKKINVNYYKYCLNCEGTGQDLTTKITCKNCKGKGSIINNSFKSTIHYIFKQTCITCNGTGYIFTSICKLCIGSGKIKDNKFINVVIPSGIDNNEIIKLKGKGISNRKGNYKGDLFIKIKVNKHPIFIRKKNNLYCEFIINFKIAILGGEVMIPTINGTKLKLKIPAGTQTGHIFKIKGKGVTTLNNSIKGDLFCTIKIETPINLNDEQKKILKQLSLSKKNTFFKKKYINDN